MVPPIWLDQHGRRRPTYPCPRLGCDRECAEPSRDSFDHLPVLGWAKPSQIMKIVNWCGHSQDFVAWSEADGHWRLVPVVDFTTSDALGRSSIL